MDGALFIFLLALTAYIPLAVVLLYVWWKYGSGERGVAIARTVFLIGSFALIFYLIVI